MTSRPSRELLNYWPAMIPATIAVVLFLTLTFRGAFRVPATLVRTLAGSTARYHELEVRWNARFLSIGEFYQHLSGMAEGAAAGDDVMLASLVGLSAQVDGPRSEAYAGVLEHVLPSLSDDRLSRTLAAATPEVRRSFRLALIDACQRTRYESPFENSTFLQRWPHTAQRLQGSGPAGAPTPGRT